MFLSGERPFVNERAEATVCGRPEGGAMLGARQVRWQ